MKKFIITLLCAIMCATAFGQTIHYRAYNLSIGMPSYSGTTWSDWEDVSVPLSINWDDGIITIASEKPQFYSIFYVGDEYKDRSGATCLDCKATDGNNLTCKVKFRIQTDGTAQLYIFYNDVAWVYNIIKS